MESGNEINSSMKHVILILPDLVPGGAQRVFIDLAEKLATAGYRATAIVAFPSRQAWSFPPATKVIPLSGTDYSYRSLPTLPALFFKLKKILENERPDAVLSTLTGMNLLTLLATRSRSRNYPVLIREASTAQNKTGFIIQALKKYLYPKATAIIAVSDGVRKDLASSINASESSLHVINNPVAKEAIRKASREDISHKWLKDKSCPVVISVGRLTKAKDYGTLIRAIDIAREKVPVKLVILGEGPERPGLEHLVHSMKLDDTVDMPGHLDNPYSFMARADVFALSSRWEGFVNVLLEALALGMPVVSTDCHSSPREILQNGEYGRLVPPGDALELSVALLDTLRSPPQREHQEKGVAHYSPEVLFEKYRALIDNPSDLHGITKNA